MALTERFERSERSAIERHGPNGQEISAEDQHLVMDVPLWRGERLGRLNQQLQQGRESMTQKIRATAAQVPKQVPRALAPKKERLEKSMAWKARMASMGQCLAPVFDLVTKEALSMMYSMYSLH